MNVQGACYFLLCWWKFLLKERVIYGPDVASMFIWSFAGSTDIFVEKEYMCG